MGRLMGFGPACLMNPAGCVGDGGGVIATWWCDGRKRVWKLWKLERRVNGGEGCGFVQSHFSFFLSFFSFFLWD